MQAMTLKPNPPITVESFEAFLKRPDYRNGPWELVEGQPVQRANTREQGMIVSRMVYLLYGHAQKRGQLGTSIRHYQDGDVYNVRMPDIAYYASGSRPVGKEGFAPLY